MIFIYNSIDGLQITGIADHDAISIHPSHTMKLFGSSRPFCFQINDEDGFIGNIVKRLYKAVRPTDNSQQMFIDSLCGVLLLHLNAIYPDVHLTDAVGKLTASQLLLVSEYIHSRLDENISMIQLCSVVHLSRFHLSRLFKNTMGLSPHRYILQSKIEYAKSFMRKSKGAILDAAYKLNFSDQSHFTKTFRKITGITPRAFLASQANRCQNHSEQVLPAKDLSAIAVSENIHLAPV